MKYVKAYWDDSRGDEYDHWGGCYYYFELGDDSYPIRQIEVYDAGNTLKYTYKVQEFDKYGRLTDQPLELDEMPHEEISAPEFNELWEKSGMVEGKPQW
ncbi:hypothetical protein [Methylophaga sp.]|uniref:hypothetical protein n=1 Tax=Methylophaga sp. TaxID=2024840 RepID=UPI003A8E7894